MTDILEKPRCSLQKIREAYYDNKFDTIRKYMNHLITAFSLFNLLLLIPDLMLVQSKASRIVIVILRVAYSLGLVGVSKVFHRIKSVRLFTLLVTLGELAAGTVYIIVFVLYDHPSFLIQAMGIEMLVLTAFLIPNRWKNMLLVAVLVSVAFFITVFLRMGVVSPIELGAAAVYILFTIFLFTVYTGKMENMQMREFAAKKELERLSSTDYLTEAVSRSKLEAEAARWINTCQKQSLPLSLVFIDVDNLKSINDKYGHCAGDCVLRELSGQFQTQLRSSDILARWGGDEFVILMPNVTEESANAMVTRIQNQIYGKDLLGGITTTCSFGVVGMKGGEDFQALLREADVQMYKKKKARSS